MSRTIRRKKEKRTAGPSRFLKCFIEVYVDHWNDTTPIHGTCKAFPKRQLEGKEYDEMYWWFHGDSKKYCGWYSGKGGRNSSRAFNEHELIKALKDPEYVPVQKSFIDDRRYCRWASPWDLK